MKKLLFLCLLLPLSCHVSPPTTELMPRPEAAAELRSDELALRMFAQIAQEQQGNIVFSPAGAEALLRMLKEGAAGQTRAEMDALPPMGEAGVPTAMQPKTAQALFLCSDKAELHEGILPETELHRVAEGSARRDINRWVSRQTKGRIPAALSELPPNTRLVPVSAVYLEEKWLEPFGTNKTRENDFTLSSGQRIKVPMMHKDTAPCLYAEGRDWQAVALFYRRNGREGAPGCFIGIRPKGEARAFARSLTPAKWRQIRRALRDDSQHGTGHLTDISLPRFRTEPVSTDLTPALRAMGMRAAFSPQTADFSRLATVPPPDVLSVHKVQQVACVKLNEEGTEAAAATYAPVIGCAAHIPPQATRTIRFDKPFIWAISDLSSNAAPWFMGLTEEP